MKDHLFQFIPIAEAIGKILHPYAEIVIHDIKEDCIVHIVNPYSGRKAGDSSMLGLMDIDLEVLHKKKDVIGPYENTGNKEQRLRSISAVLKDNQGKSIGILCMNLDFSVMEAGLDILNSFLRPKNIAAPPPVLFKNDWKNSIKIEIDAFLKENNIVIEKLNAKNRKHLIHQLDKKGLFYARKSIEQIANLLGISRATAYKDLNKVRKKDINPTKTLKRRINDKP
jgi:D-arginine utilization repressor